MENVKVDVVNTRTVSGTFVAKDGTPVAIGGMIEDVDQKKKTQVPVLGDIPIIGFPFQARDDKKARRELVVVIRPHIMLKPEESGGVTDNLLRRNAPAAHDALKENQNSESSSGFESGSSKGAEIGISPDAPGKKGSLIQDRKKRFSR